MAENFYCPRCAQSFTAGTSFCRTCGLELARVTSLVQGDVTDAQPVKVRPNMKLMMAGIGLFILSLIVGLVFGALREFELFSDRYGKAIFFAFVAVAMLTIGSGFVFPARKYPKRTITDDPDQKHPAKTTVLAVLPDAPGRSHEVDSFLKASGRHAGEPASVTERTTRNLE